MPFPIRPYGRFFFQCAVTYNARPFQGQGTSPVGETTQGNGERSSVRRVKVRRGIGVAIGVFVFLVTISTNSRADLGWLFWTEERNYGPTTMNQPFKWVFKNAYPSWQDCETVRSREWKKASAGTQDKIREPTLGFFLKSENETLEKYFYCLPVGFNPRGTTGR